MQRIGATPACAAKAGLLKRSRDLQFIEDLAASADYTQISEQKPCPSAHRFPGAAQHPKHSQPQDPDLRPTWALPLAPIRYNSSQVAVTICSPSRRAVAQPQWNHASELSTAQHWQQDGRTTRVQQHQGYHNASDSGKQSGSLHFVTVIVPTPSTTGPAPSSLLPMKWPAAPPKPMQPAPRGRSTNPGIL
mgnify:CR=1 FL=1